MAAHAARFRGFRGSDSRVGESEQRDKVTGLRVADPQVSD
jgi:hypothetical protein